jgi:hypothetical protein
MEARRELNASDSPAMDLDTINCLAMAVTAQDGAAALRDLLQHLGTAAILLDADAKVVGLTAAAGNCLGDELHIRNRRLLATDASAQRALTALIAASRNAHTAPACGGEPVVVLRRSTRPLILRLIRLDARATALFRPATAIVLVLDADRVSLPTEAQLGSAFGLSCGEARLAIQLAAGQMLESAAAHCGISYETARKRLKVVFEKTDTCRQSDLVALIIRVGTLTGAASMIAADTTSLRLQPALSNGRPLPFRRPSQSESQGTSQGPSRNAQAISRTSRLRQVSTA